MMAAGWALWAAMAALLAAAPPPGAWSFTHLGGNLCRWCEASSPACLDDVCFSNCSLSSFCSLAEEICIAIWRKTNETTTVHTTCHNPALPLEGISPALLLNFTSRECHMTSQPAEDATLMVCGCRGEHECNDKLIFDQGANGFSKLQNKDLVPVVLVSLVPPLLVAVAATLAFYFYRSRQEDKPDSPGRPDWPPKRSTELYLASDLPCGAVPGGEGGCAGDVTGSGVELEPSKHPTSNVTGGAGEVTELLPIKLEVLVGKGRFAEVWLGRLLQAEKAEGTVHDPVAVKVFPAVEYESWRNECSILSDPKMEHGNIVRFLAAEDRGPPGHALRQYWLVLAYHSLGNLQDFLAAKLLSWDELVAMAGSIAKGLAHLHSDTTPGGLPKVPVAHRDLKSSNIVMKSRSECALCDFGLALRLDLSLTVDDYANSGQVGTARYMAPEVLESRVNLEDLEAFKQMDVYSMALVLWEMASRCRANGGLIPDVGMSSLLSEVRSYEPAFGSQVCEQPCVDSMRDLVLRDRGRPDIPATWSRHKGLSIFCSTIMECWDHDPEARLTAHCVVERFTALQEDQEELRNEADAHRRKDPEAPEEDQETGSSTEAQPQNQEPHHPLGFSGVRQPPGPNVG